MAGITAHGGQHFEIGYSTKIATISGVSFGTGIRIVLIRWHDDSRSVDTVTSTSGATFTPQNIGVVNMAMFTAPEAAAAIEDITVTLTASVGNMTILAATGEGLASNEAVELATKLKVSEADPKLFDDTLITPAGGAGLAFCWGVSTGITANNGTLLSSMAGASGHQLALVEYAEGTLTPSFNSGTHNQAAGLAAAWEPAAAGGTIHTGAAALNGTGTATATATAERKGAAAVAGSSSFTASARLVQPGAAALAGTGSLAATAHKVLPSSALLAGAGSLAASGSRKVAGAANLNGAGTLTSTARAARNASAAMVGTGTMTAVGLTGSQVSAAALMAGTGTFAATASIRFGGAAGLAGMGTLSVAAPAATRAASAVLAGVGGLSALSTLEAHAAASLAGVGTLAAIGRSEAPRSATVSRPGLNTFTARPPMIQHSRPRAVSTGRR